MAGVCFFVLGALGVDVIGIVCLGMLGVKLVSLLDLFFSSRARKELRVVRQFMLLKLFYVCLRAVRMDCAEIFLSPNRDIVRSRKLLATYTFSLWSEY